MCHYPRLVLQIFILFYLSKDFFLDVLIKKLQFELIRTSWNRWKHNFTNFFDLERVGSLFLWWLDPVQTPDANQVAPSLSSSMGHRGRHEMKGLWVRIRTGRHLSWTKQTQLQEISLIYYKLSQIRIVRKLNQILKTPSFHPSLLPGLNFTTSFLYFLPSAVQGNGYCPKLMFSLPLLFHHTLPLLWCGVPPTD